MASLRSISSSSTSPEAPPVRPAVYLKAAIPVPNAAPAPSMNGRLRPDIHVSPVRTTSSRAHTEDASGHTGGSASVEFVVAVVLLLHVRGRVERELVCASSAGCRSISSPTLPSAPIEGWRTEQSNNSSRPCQDAHGSDVLLAEGVLHTGEDGADHAGREHGVARVVEGVPGVVCGVLFGHGGGRHGCGHLDCVWGALLSSPACLSLKLAPGFLAPALGRIGGARSAAASSAAMPCMHMCWMVAQREARQAACITFFSAAHPKLSSHAICVYMLFFDTFVILLLLRALPLTSLSACHLPCAYV